MFPFDFLREPLWQPLTWTLLHFLWQGAVIAIGVMILRYLLPMRQASHRYLVYLSALLVMAICPVATFLALDASATVTIASQDHDVEPPAVPEPMPMPEPVKVAEVDTALPPAPVLPLVGENALPPAPIEMVVPAPLVPEVSETAETVLAPPRSESKLQGYINAIQPYALVIWIVGVLLLAIRLLLSWLHVRWLRWGCQAIRDEIAGTAVSLGKRLGLRFPPRVYASEKIRGAIVVGLWRPLILLPASWLLIVPPEVLEAVIAHELAHIRRFDLWVNLLQRLMETVLFYHPAVWYLSRRLSVEREMCADDLAVCATKDRLLYVTALERLGRMRLSPNAPRLGTSIGGNKMALLNRVGNLLGLAAPNKKARWWPVGLLTLALPLIIWSVSMHFGLPAEHKAHADEIQVTDEASDKAAEEANGEFKKLEAQANPLGLDDKMLGNLFATGDALKRVGSDCESHYNKHKRLPKDISDLIAKQYHPTVHRVIGRDPFAPGKKLRLVRVPNHPQEIQVWSVGPDGDWDGGREIDSTKKPLDGDIGLTCRVDRSDSGKFLADSTISQCLDGLRLSHYLAAKGPKFPKPVLKDDGLAWGPVVDGLQLAVELKPKQDFYYRGETIDVRFHFRNAADYAIQVGMPMPSKQDMMEDSVFIKNEKGERLKTHSVWMSDMASYIEQQTLKPGETTTYENTDLAFVAPGKKPGEDGVSHWVEAEPGEYTVWFKQHFPTACVLGNEYRWNGKLETAPVKVRIAKDPKFAIHLVKGCRYTGKNPNSTSYVYFRHFLDNGKKEDRFDTMHPERYPLDDLVLDGTPLVTEADLVAYDWDHHVMYLKPEAHQRLAKIKPSLWGVPFLVQSEGKPIYLGAFWSLFSSYSADMPTIGMGPLESPLKYKAPENIPSDLAKYAVQILNNWMSKPGQLPQDPRQNGRLQRALTEAGKISAKDAKRYPFGKPVKKIQTRLRYGGMAASGEPWFYFDLRNDSKDFSVPLGPDAIPMEILIDGTPYHWEGRLAGKLPLPVCKPGQRVYGAHFGLSSNWFAVEKGKKVKRPDLTPGRHTIQAVVYAEGPPMRGRPNKVKVLSNPLEFEIPQPIPETSVEANKLMQVLQTVAPQVKIQVDFPGHSPTEVEQLITTPLEEMLSKINSIESVESVSIENRAVITVRYQAGEDRKQSLEELNKKIREDANLFPPGVTGWSVKPEKPQPAATIDSSKENTERTTRHKTDEDLKHYPKLFGTKSVRLASSPDNHGPDTWSKAVEGVQCRLTTPKPLWEDELFPLFDVDFRNLGKRSVEIDFSSVAKANEVQYDGVWYRCTVRHTGLIDSLQIEPGIQCNDIELKLNDDWTRYDKEKKKEVPLVLKPGKHTVRFAFRVYKKDRKGTVRLETNPVEFKIIKKSTPIAWGKAKEGLQLGMRPENTDNPNRGYSPGGYGFFSLYVRNTSKHTRILIAPALFPSLQIRDDQGKPAHTFGNIPKGMGIVMHRKVVSPGETIEVGFNFFKLNKSNLDDEKAVIGYGHNSIEPQVDLAPGKYRASQSYTFGKEEGSTGKTSKWVFLGKLTSGVADFAVAEPKSGTSVEPKETATETPWGKPAEKIQSRLRSADIRDGVPNLYFDLRNKSSQFSAQLGPNGRPSGIVVDGVAYVWGTGIAGSLPVCKPGKNSMGVKFKLDGNWVTAVNLGQPMQLHLKPGKHKIQAVVYASGPPMLGRPNQVKVLSNTVEIEIPKKRLPQVKQLPFSKPVEGIQSRLRYGTIDDIVPRFYFDLRNDSEKFSVQLGPDNIPTHLLIDGVPYHWSERIAGKLPVCKPGRKAYGARFRLDGKWFDDKLKPLHLKPGRHTVQAIVYAAGPPMRGRPRKIEIRSNPIEFETDHFFKYEKAAWGKTVDGLQLGVFLESVNGPDFYAGKEVRFSVLVRNTSKKAKVLTYSRPFLPPPLEIQNAEGKRILVHQPVINMPVTRRIQTIKPGDMIGLGMCQLYLLADGEKPGPDIANDIFLMRALLPPGKYRVRQPYTFISSDDPKTDFAGTLTSGETDLVVVAKPKPKTSATSTEPKETSAETPWGKPVKEIQSQLRLIDFYKGMPLLRFDLRNGSKDLTIPLGPHKMPHEIIVDGNVYTYCGDYTGPQMFCKPGESVVGPCNPGKCWFGKDPGKSLILDLKPGRHTVQAVVYASDQKTHVEDQIGTRIVSNTVKIEVPQPKHKTTDASATLAEPNEAEARARIERFYKAPWGKPVEGLRSRLRLDGIRNGMPWFYYDLRNGSKDFSAPLGPGGRPAEMVVDGLTYCWGGRIASSASVCKPGGNSMNVPFMLDRNWTIKKMKGLPTFLQLKPGKHKIQAVVYATGPPILGLPKQVKIVSNTVEITIPARSKTSKPSTVWGKKVEDIQSRLRLDDIRDGVPSFYFDLRNKSKKLSIHHLISLAGAPGEVLVDGVAYQWLGPTREVPPLCQPGKSFLDVKFEIGNSWFHKDKDGKLKPLDWKPGRHTVQAVAYARDLNLAVENPVDVKILSNTVEITIPAKSKMSKPSTVWGKSVEGVQCSLSAEKNRWKMEETPKFKIDLRNQGKHGMDAFTDPESLKIRYDGISYYFHFKGVVNWSPEPLKPGTRHEKNILLDNNWLTKDQNPRPLVLTPGKHTLQVSFPILPMFNAEDNTTPERNHATPKKDFRMPEVESNSFEFEITPDPKEKEKKTPRAAWGKTVNDLQLGLTFDPADQSEFHETGTVHLKVLVRNMGKNSKGLSYLSHVSGLGLTMEDADGNPVPIGLQSVDIKAGRIDKTIPPHQTIELEKIDLKLGTKKPHGRNPYASPRPGKYYLWQKFPFDGNSSKLTSGKLEMAVEDKPRGKH